MGPPPSRRPGPRRGGLARHEGRIVSYIFALLAKEVHLKPRRSSPAAPRRARPASALRTTRARRAGVRSGGHGRLN